MGVVYLCKICGREHNTPSGGATRELFESASARAKSIECSSTGRSAQYVKKDMRWKESR